MLLKRSNGAICIYFYIVLGLIFQFVIIKSLFAQVEQSAQTEQSVVTEQPVQTDQGVQAEQVVSSDPNDKKVEGSEKFNVSPIFAPTSPDEQIEDTSKHFISALAGVGYRQTNWKYSIDSSNTHSSYKIDNATYTSYEGNLSFNKIYTRLGFVASAEDQTISDIKKFSGYLGIKNILFRTETGKFKGTVDYRGFSTNNILQRFDFDQKYSYSEAVYMFDKTPFFAGIRSTKWRLPLEIVALEKDRDSGQTVFDRDFNFRYTSLSIGMDYMSQIMMNPQLFRSGWGIMGKVTGNYGWGEAKIGSQAADDATRIYGGGKHFTETSFGMLTAEMEASLGVMYAKGWKYVRMVMGLGYNYNLFALSSMASTAETTDELTPVALVYFHNHGPIFRMQILF